MAAPKQLAATLTTPVVTSNPGNRPPPSGVAFDGPGRRAWRTPATGKQEHACLERLKQAEPELRSSTQIRISASPGIDYATVVAAADAARTADDGSELFAEVSFGVPR